MHLVQESQFKVGNLATFPHEEGVVFELVEGFVAGDACNGAILNTPQLRIAFPAIEVLAIEQRGELLSLGGSGKTNEQG